MFPALVLLRASVLSGRTSVVDHARLLVAFFMMSHLQSYLSNAENWKQQNRLQLCDVFERVIKDARS